jgi:hypothetical protein
MPVSRCVSLYGLLRKLPNIGTEAKKKKMKALL